MSNHCANKAYALYFSEGSREELKGRGVKVSVLCPGSIRTAFFWEARIWLSRLDRSKLMMTPEKVTLLALRGLDENRTLIVPG